MRKRSIELEAYLSNGVENIIKGAIRATLKYPKESKFLIQYTQASRKAGIKRASAEAAGTHIPPFLIASITIQCNLHCKGCYARENHSCHDGAGAGQLSAAQWGIIFEEASEMGISFILLAGGEPLIRKDVILEAANYQNILFPVFTNGVMIDQYITILDNYRNLVPILSIEGDASLTDNRRGEGMYQILMSRMELLQKRGILFGASITVTTENLNEVTSDLFLRELTARGCKAVIYVEYVPVNQETAGLAPGEHERNQMNRRLHELRSQMEEMLFISFPGDEASSGGCLAAGRGFFHINASGGAEPCPFSPYSDTKLPDVSLHDAMQSPLFQKLRSEEILMKEHIGGCVLFEQEETVKELLQLSI